MDNRELQRSGYPLTIPDSLLQSEAMQRACAARDFQEIFRLVNRRTGSSYAVMAAAIGKMTSARVSDIVRGVRGIRGREVIERVADAFGIPGETLGLAKRSWEYTGPAEVEKTKRRDAVKLAGLAFAAPAVTAEILEQAAAEAVEFTRQAEASALDFGTLDHLDLAVVEFNRAYSLKPPQQVFEAVLDYRRKVDALLKAEHTHRQGRELFAFAGWLSELLAWLAHDLGNARTGLAFATDAFAHGQQAGHGQLCAWAMDAAASINLYEQRPAQALAAARRGLAEAPGGHPLTVRLHAQARAPAQPTATPKALRPRSTRPKTPTSCFRHARHAGSAWMSCRWRNTRSPPTPRPPVSGSAWPTRHVSTPNAPSRLTDQLRERPGHPVARPSLASTWPSPAPNSVTLTRPSLSAIKLSTPPVSWTPYAAGPMTSPPTSPAASRAGRRWRAYANAWPLPTRAPPAPQRPQTTLEPEGIPTTLATNARQEHALNIRKPYFDLISQGIKTIEVRVGYPKIRRIAVGDLLRFTSGDETLHTRVTEVAEYRSFTAMLDAEDNAAIGAHSMSRAELLDVIREIYPPEKEALGVFAIHIEPAKEPKRD
ncbi:ASCH domain-containing protein [Streptomyces sp. NPDC002851]